MCAAAHKIETERDKERRDLDYSKAEKRGLDLASCCSTSITLRIQIQSLAVFNGGKQCATKEFRGTLVYVIISWTEKEMIH